MCETDGRTDGQARRLMNRTEQNRTFIKMLQRRAGLSTIKILDNIKL